MRRVLQLYEVFLALLNFWPSENMAKLFNFWLDGAWQSMMQRKKFLKEEMFLGPVLG